MKFINWLVLVLIISPTLHAQDEGNKISRGYINLSQGIPYDERVSDLPDGAQFEGDYKRVTKVLLDASTKTLRFDPKQLGSGNLVILDSRGKKFREYYIQVVKGNLNKVASEIRQQLSEIEGITIKVLNGKVVVDGEVLLPKDLNRIISVVSLYDGQATSIVQISPISQKKIAELIERDINNPEITTRAVNGKFILEGYANNDDEKAKAEIMAKTYVPDIVVQPGVAAGLIKELNTLQVINLINVKPQSAPPPKKIIQLVIHYVELKKDYEKGFRFQWTPDLKDGAKMEFSSSSREPSGILSSITGTIDNLLPKLNWAKGHGHARVLQSSNIVVQEGTAGKLESYTDVPYQSTGAQGQINTGFVKAGIETSITPTITNPQSDSIALDIKFKIGSLVGLTSGVPMVSNNVIQTALTVRSGQSAAIGGLVSNTSGSDYNKLPKGQSDNPIISLYSSKNFRRDQSQFVVFVTPVIKSSASAGSERIKSKFKLKD